MFPYQKVMENLSKLNEIMSVADRCTVLRKGKYVGTVDIKDTTKEELSRVFAATAGRPIYVTNYRWSENADRTYEACAEELVMAMEAGGTLADVPGDFFCEDKEYQMTDNEEAIEKQMALIDRLHKMNLFKLELMPCFEPNFD